MAQSIMFVTEILCRFTMVRAKLRGRQERERERKKEENGMGKERFERRTN